MNSYKILSYLKQSKCKEEIDSADSEEEAIFLRKEYQLAFGPSFIITVEHPVEFLHTE